jgi:hypothetical protein
MPSAPRARRLPASLPDEEAERALDWAEVAAMLGDYGDAVAWLDRVHELRGSLPDELAARRLDWIVRVR